MVDKRVVDKRAYFNRIGYTPHSTGQMSYHESAARFRIPVCGRRYGKSLMSARDVTPRLFLPDKKYWIVGPTYDLGDKEFKVIWDDLIVRQALGRDKRVKKAYNKRSGDMYINFPWRTSIEVRSAEHPEGLVGEGLDGVIMSEAAKHKRETWERYIRPALADRRGWADFPTTPEGYNWLYELWQFGQNPELKDYASWKFPSWENRVLFPGGREDPEIVLLAKTTTPEWFAQEIGAEFSSFIGRIYGEFDETVHVRSHVYNPAWQNFLAFDWGYVNPLAAIEFQISPQDDVYVWREHYRAYLRVEDHCEILRKRDQPEGYHLDVAFGDAADPEAAATVSAKLVACYALPEAKANWRQGIDLVKTFLKQYQTGVMDEYGTPEMHPKLFIDPGCPNIIREFNNYRAVDVTKRNAPRESGSSGAAQKQDDHALDALRYGLMHYFELGVKHHLDEVYSMSQLRSDAPSTGYFTTATMEF